jgi:signal peptidase I
VHSSAHVDRDNTPRSPARRAAHAAWRLLLGASILVAVVSAMMNVGPWAWAKYVHGDSVAVAVTSNSMQPVFSARDVLAVRPVDPADLQVGDIATIRRPTGTMVTHRIVAVEPGPGGQVMLRTKGDANDTEDYDVASGDQVLGVVDGIIPSIGEAMVWLQTTLGRIVSFAPVGLCFVFVECRDLWREPKPEVRPVVPKTTKRGQGRHRRLDPAAPETGGGKD